MSTNLTSYQVIFLDIDGVLNSTDSVFTKIGRRNKTDIQINFERDMLDHLGLAFFEELPYGVRAGLDTVNPTAVALLNRLITECTNPCLVLSSTHRKHFQKIYAYGSTAHKTVLKNYLGAMGVHVPMMFSLTPTLYTERGREVQHWIDESQVSISSYVILDDGADFSSGQNLVRCDPTFGFTFKNYAEACKFLHLSEPGIILI